MCVKYFICVLACKIYFIYSYMKYLIFLTLRPFQRENLVIPMVWSMGRNVFIAPFIAPFFELLRPFLSFTIKVIKSRTDQLEIKNVTHVCQCNHLAVYHWSSACLLLRRINQTISHADAIKTKNMYLHTAYNYTRLKRLE